MTPAKKPATKAAGTAKKTTTKPTGLPATAFGIDIGGSGIKGTLVDLATGQPDELPLAA